MRRRIVTAAVLALLFAAAPAQASPGPTRDCGMIGFTPNSDDVAAGIRATRVSCRHARRFVRDSEGSPGARFRGFRCTSVPVDEGDQLAHRRFRCVRGAAVIRWRRY